MKRTASLTTKLLAYLKVHGHISPMEFRTVFTAERLAARVCDLRAEGFKIATTTVTDFEGKTYTRYELASHRAIRGTRAIRTAALA